MALEIQISVLKISDRRSVLKCPSVFPRRGLLDTGGHIPKCNRAVICRHLRILAELVRPSTKGKTCHMLHVHLHSLSSLRIRNVWLMILGVDLAMKEYAFFLKSLFRS